MLKFIKTWKTWRKKSQKEISGKYAVRSSTYYLFSLSEWVIRIKQAEDMQSFPSDSQV